MKNKTLHIMAALMISVASYQAVSQQIEGCQDSREYLDCCKSFVASPGTGCVKTDCGGMGNYINKMCSGEGNMWTGCENITYQLTPTYTTWPSNPNPPVGCLWTQVPTVSYGDPITCDDFDFITSCF